MAMKLRFSCTHKQDTSVGLLPGMAGKILVQRGFPLSLLSRFQTFTWKQLWLIKNLLHKCDYLGFFKSAANLLEDLFRVHPAPLTQGCCAASAGRDGLRATCKPEKMSTAGSASKARSCHPYVTFWKLRTIYCCCTRWSKQGIYASSRVVIPVVVLDMVIKARLSFTGFKKFQSAKHIPVNSNQSCQLYISISVKQCCINALILNKSFACMFTQKCLNCLLITLLMESRVEFHSPQNISLAWQENWAAIILINN